MILAEVKVSGVCAYATRKRLIPAGIVGAQVSFSFTDPKWDNLTKTVVFKGFGTKDVLLEGDTVRIPQEVVSRKDVRLLVGVYGTDAEKNIAIPTLWADLGTVRNATDPSGDEAADPALPIWATLQAEIDKLKENGASDEQIAAAVEAYLQKNTVGTGTVKMVNDIEPDENGNVVIDIPKDYVKTVNGATPDENGNIEIEIPDSGGNVDLGVTGATVGQTVKISAVDENGVPTAWESVNFPDSYTKPEIDAIMGSYITDIDTLVGGDG